jgi:hypothetical protein
MTNLYSYSGVFALFLIDKIQTTKVLSYHVFSNKQLNL